MAKEVATLANQVGAVAAVAKVTNQAAEKVAKAVVAVTTPSQAAAKKKEVEAVAKVTKKAAAAEDFFLRQIIELLLHHIKHLVLVQILFINRPIL